MDREILRGPGMWIWRIAETAGGNPERIAREAARQQFRHVLIKINQDERPYNGQRLSSTVAQTKPAGVQVAGWGYCTGADPEAEARAALDLTRALGLRVYVLNGEKEFETYGGAERMCRFLRAFRASGGDEIGLGLSTFALPRLHPAFPYRAALEGIDACDFVLPQIYTVPSKRLPWLARAVDYFDRSREQLLGFGKPVIPTLRAYRGDGVWDWPAITEDAIRFVKAAPGLSLDAWNWWNWQAAQQHGPLWKAMGSQLAAQSKEETMKNHP